MKWIYEKQSHIAKLGRYKIFTIIEDPNLKKSDICRYRLINFLPGLNPSLGLFETVELARDCAIHVFTKWCENSGMTLNKETK